MANAGILPAGQLDEEHPDSSDFELWRARGMVPGSDCLMGHKVGERRRLERLTGINGCCAALDVLLAPQEGRPLLRGSSAGRGSQARQLSLHEAGLRMVGG